MPVPLRRLIQAGIVLGAIQWLPAPAQATTAYIIDEIRVSLRASPCQTCAVVEHGLTTGLRLEVLTANDGWSRVRTPAGKEGWLASRYLTEQPAAREQLDILRQQVEQLRAENRALQAHTTGADGTTPTPAATAATATAPETLLGGLPSADCPDLQPQNQELLKTNKLLQSEAEVLRARLQQLESNERQRWFFYGGVLVALGAVLCALLPRLKPNRGGYSEWR